MTAQPHHIAFDVLLQDWLGETDPATREGIDAHLMACDTCGGLLDEIAALGDGIRRAVHAGAVDVVTGAGLVRRLADAGLHLREYRVGPSGSVHCSVAPDDQVLVSRLQAPLQGVRQLDMAVELSIEPGVVHRIEDIPFDPASGEVVFLSSLDKVRRLPSHTITLTLLAREGGSSREVGRYLFHHSRSAQ